MMGRSIENVVNDRVPLPRSSHVQGKKLQEYPASVQAQFAVSKKQFIILIQLYMFVVLNMKAVHG